MSIIYWLIIGAAVYFFILKPIEKYLQRRGEEKLVLRVENRINSMSMEEKLAILNSDDYKKWWMVIMDSGGSIEEDGDYSKMVKTYMLDNLNRFF
jgi:hypothetical protein